MPLFYLHIRDGDDVIEDPDGSDLPDIEAAKEEARVSARHILAERVRDGRVIGSQNFDIVDEVGNLCARVWMREVLRLA
jgi:hypothetical protein